MTQALLILRIVGFSFFFFYRGEKAFCSSYCRFEIVAEKEMEKALSCAPGTPKSVCDDDEEDAIFVTDMASVS